MATMRPVDRLRAGRKSLREQPHDQQRAALQREHGRIHQAFVPGGSKELTQPSGLTFGPDGNLYVASHGPNPVLQYCWATGQLLSIFVPADSGMIRNPTSLRFGPDGNLYVNSRGNSRVLRFDGTSGDFIDTFVPQGTGGLSAPNSMLFFTPARGN